MRNLYPGYDVLSKRDTPSWNEQTRRVIERRVAVQGDEHAFFEENEWLILRSLCDRIVPQPEDREAIPVAAMVDKKMVENAQDGYRNAKLPPMREAWRLGLAAVDAEAQAVHGKKFHELSPDDQDKLISAMQKGELHDAAWNGMPSGLFFMRRVIPDIVKAYYEHPTAWNEIGWGGPASPRGYVRMQLNRRDAWEAAEAKPGHEEEAYWENKRVGS